MKHFAAVLLLLTTAAQPSAPTQVDWRWDLEGPGCALRQVVGAGGSTLGIARTPGNDQTVVRIGPYDWPPPSQWRKSETLQAGRVTLSPGDTVAVDLRVATFENGGRDIGASVGSDFVSMFAKDAVIEFSHEKLGSVRVPVRTSAAAVAALQTCEDSKMREWGIDPVAWRALKIKPEPVQSRTEWLTGDDYPNLAAAYGVQGWVIARLEIAPDGGVKDCRSINLDKYRGFRDSVCQAMKKRARFRPALDSSGKPVAAPYVLAIRFALA